MTVFVDASAIVAIIAREPEADTFDKRLRWEEERLTSPTAMWEAVRAVAKARGVPFMEARQLVADFLAAYEFTVVAIGAAEGDLALAAHERFGKGIHPAELNFGDCFSYACAKLRDVPLLFKGEDFARTDIRDATLE